MTGLGSEETARALPGPGMGLQPPPTSSRGCGRHWQPGRFVGCSPTEPPGLAFSAQALLAVKSVPVDEDPETEVPTHPEDGVPQPGNSKVRGRPGLWGRRPVG